MTKFTKVKMEMENISGGQRRNKEIKDINLKIDAMGPAHKMKITFWLH